MTYARVLTFLQKKANKFGHIKKKLYLCAVIVKKDKNNTQNPINFFI